MTKYVISDNLTTADVVKEGAVASKYSPGHYLQALWENALSLHADSDELNLKTRRPDLEKLMLSQENMDSPVSVLSLINKALIEFCAKNNIGGATDVDTVVPLLSTSKEANYYHQALDSMRCLLKEISEYEFPNVYSVIENEIFSGMVASDSVKLDSQRGHIWRLTELYGVKEELAKVMCGYNISGTPETDEATGTIIPSQINRLFNVADDKLPTFESDDDLKKSLKKAFGVNDTDLTLLALLSGITLSKDLQLDDISNIYGWSLLANVLHCTIPELVILNKIAPASEDYLRHKVFGSVIDWLENNKITITQLLLLTEPMVGRLTPAMTGMLEELKRDAKVPGGLKTTTLAGAIATVFGLSSVSQAEAMINWMDTDILAEQKKSKGFISCFSPQKTRYLLFKIPFSTSLTINKVQLMVNGNDIHDEIFHGTHDPSLTIGNDNYAQDGYDDSTFSFTAADSGSSSYLQMDLGYEYPIEQIVLTGSYSVAESLSNDSEKGFLITSQQDMSSLMGKFNPNDNDLFGVYVQGAINLDDKNVNGTQTFNVTHNSDYAVITYMNRLSNRANVINSLGLTDNIVNMLSKTTDPLENKTDDADNIVFSLERLQTLSRLKTLNDRCGSNAPLFLQQLTDSSLSVSDLSQYLSINSELLTNQPASYSLDFNTANAMLDNYLFCQRTGISLNSLAALENLSSGESYADWASISNTMIDEISTERRSVLQQQLDEGLSKALCLFITKQKDAKYTTPEAISNYLLTDVKTSAQSQTSKVAWAIASIQLYIDRCLTGEEQGAAIPATGSDNANFFNNWNTYNRRYSQWAGLAELMNEPENYLDPSLRITQSGSFKNLLQRLNSGPLDEMSAEDAFSSYLTDFEKMAEIVTVNAFHDNYSDAIGITWFVGYSKESPTEWYWRSVNHTTLLGNMAPVRAWTTWEKIDLPIMPRKKEGALLARPVYVNNRLYIVWLEARDSKAPAADQTTKPVTTTDCILKLSYQRHDGSWTSPAENIIYSYIPDPKSTTDQFPDLKLTADIQNNEIIFTLGNDVYTVESTAQTYVNQGNYISGQYNSDNDSIHVMMPAYQSNATDGRIEKLGDEELPFGLDFVSGTYKAGNGTNILHIVFSQGGKYLTFEGAMNSDTGITIPVNGAGNSSPFDISGISLSGPDIPPSIVIKNTTDNPVRWTLNLIGKDYALSSEYPVELLKLMAQDIDAVFTMDELRKRSDILQLLDFDGALGIYYWELFYHVPLLISLRLLEMQEYEQANIWLSYIFNPYNNDGKYWNPIPLASTTPSTWTLDPNSTDPDAVAETHPQHYRLAVAMRLLDLLIARGDSNYRLLERDTLVEAQMWYMRALDILGSRKEAAYDTSFVPTLLGEITDGDFKDQENKKLYGYWQLLGQRLFNLRNNLTLDGQPLNLPLFATPANPENLLSAALNADSNLSSLTNNGSVGLLRFKPALELARGLAGQLVQFGNTFQGVCERQDAEAMSLLLHTHGRQLMSISCDIQDSTLAALDADLAALQAQSDDVTLRVTYYTSLFAENISANEQSALGMSTTAAALLIAGGASNVAGGALDTALPNTFGLADGGNRWGGVLNGVGALLSNTAFSLNNIAGSLTQIDSYRRRRNEWKLEIDSANTLLKQLSKQQAALQARREAASMQKTYLLTQQNQLNDQLQLLKGKFTSQQLYGWMKSRISMIFWQFYDISINAALRAEKAYIFEMGQNTQPVIRPGAWQSSASGLLCGESLLLDLACMEQEWLNGNMRALEVTRTVSVADLLKGKDDTGKVAGLPGAIKELMTVPPSATEFTWNSDSLKHHLTLNGTVLECGISLSALNIPADYPDQLKLGATRRIKNINVSLPALIGPYQDIQAVLSYTSDTTFSAPPGCSAIAISHGINDSGQFQLDFSDPRYLPFEGVTLRGPDDADNTGVLLLQFPVSKSSQQSLVSSLNDIILHIHYTIQD